MDLMTFEPSPGPEPSALLRQAPALVWVTDRDLRFLAVHAGSLLDAELAEGAVGRSLLDFVAPGSASAAAHREALAGGSGRYAYATQDRAWSVSVEPLRDAAGEVTGCVAVAVDASEERARELELAEAREGLRALAENLPVVVYTVGLDEDPRPRFVGSGIEELLGVPAQAFTFEHLRAAVHPDDRARVLPAMDEADRNAADLRIEFRIVRGDGETRWIEDSSRVVNVAGEWLAQGYLLDITDRKKAEAQLVRRAHTRRTLAELARRSVAGATLEELMAGMLDLLREGIEADTGSYLELSGDGTLVVEAGFGWPDAVGEVAVAGAPALEVATTGRTFVSGDVRPAPGSLRHRAGINSTVAAPVAVGGEVFGVIAVHSRRRDAFDANDVSLVEHAGSLAGAAKARERAEQQRRSIEAQLLHAQRLEAVGQLAAGIAHDFNNLLTAVSGYTELAQNVNTDARVASYLGEVRTAGDRARDLIAQLLAFSRKQRLEPRELAVADVVLGLEPMLLTLLGKRRELELRLDDDVAGIFVDPAQLENILMNVAANARDAMPDGGTLVVATGTQVVDDEEAREEEVEPGSYTTISLADDGAGIPAEIVGRVFEPFFTTKPTGKGTGLGLASVYGTVRQSGGFVRLRSEVGVGTELVLAFPAAAGV
jgi:PAS domain S-box-containing protein